MISKLIKQRKKLKKTVIGRADRVDLPDFDLWNVDAKIDTGAYTNVIHGTRIRLDEANGKKLLSFYIYNSGHGGNKRKKYYFETFSKKNIKSSNGQSELRFIIKASIVLFGRKFKTDFSLTNRLKMKYPVLIGRKFLKGKFLVDVSSHDLSFRLKEGK